MEPLIEEFLNFLSVERGLAQNSIVSYGRDLRKFTSFLKKTGITFLDLVSRDHIDLFLYQLKNQGLSASSICRNLAALRTFYRYLANQHHIKQNPLELVDSPKLWKKIPEVLNLGEIERILTAPKGKGWQSLRDKACLELMYACGLRVSEIINLKLNQVDLEVGFVKCTGKGQKERVIPLGSKAKQAIKEYLNNGRPQISKSSYTKVLFLTRLGRGMTRQSFWKMVKYYVRQALLNMDQSTICFHQTYHRLSGL